MFKDREPAWPKHHEIKAGLDRYERSLLIDEELKLVGLSLYLVSINIPTWIPHRSTQRSKIEVIGDGQTG